MQASHKINSAFQSCFTASITQGAGEKYRYSRLQSKERHGNAYYDKPLGDSYLAILEHIQVRCPLASLCFDPFILWAPGPIFSRVLAFA